MSDNKNTIFGGFDLIADALKPNTEGQTVPSDDENFIDIDDPAELAVDDDEEEIEDPIEEEDDDVPAPKADNKIKTNLPKEEPKNDADDLSEVEPDIAAFFQEKLAEELGWEFADDEKFASVSDAVEYMGRMVEEASKPRYASEEVAAYDEFVRNGGNLRDFFSQTHDGTLDISKVDIDRESDQKAVLKELYREQGLKDAIIDKRISRYEDTGVLAEEAEEALSLLTDIKEEKKVKLLEGQKIQKREQEKQQREFLTSVEKTVKEMKNIRGIAITESEKKEILDYMFKPTSDGTTQYQKEYMSNVKNLIESAYFTKKGDILLDRAKKQAASDTAIDLRKKINAKKGNRLSGRDNQDNGSFNQGFGSLSNMLLKKV